MPFEKFLAKNTSKTFFNGDNLCLFDIWFLPLARAVLELLMIFHNFDMKKSGLGYLQELVFFKADQNESFYDSQDEDVIIFCQFKFVGQIFFNFFSGTHFK